MPTFIANMIIKERFKYSEIFDYVIYKKFKKQVKEILIARGEEKYIEE